MVDVRTRQADAARPLRLAPRGEQPLRRAKKLIAHGFASAHSEPRGKRRRTVYAITPSGRLALADWLGKPAAEPRWEAESMVKFTFATGGSKEQLLANLCDFRRHATARWKAVEAIFRPYLEGNEPFPERTHINVLPGRLLLETARLQAEWADRTIEEVQKWHTTAGPEITRQRSPHWKPRSPPERPECNPRQ